MRPIFIISTTRSGSSAMAHILTNHLKIQGYLEGHFLSYINQYHNLTNQIFDNLAVGELHPDVAMGNINKEFFFHKILSAFKDTYEELFDKTQPYWVDKTPNTSIMNIQYCLNMWPEAKFIILKRRSLENVNSGKHKHKNLTFAQNCQRWTTFMSSWYDFDKSILKNNFIEIENYDMLFNPEKVANDIVKLLPEYRQKKHRIISFLQSDNYPSSTTEGGPKIYDINTIDWTEEQKTIHNEICVPVLHLYNYSLDQNYFIQ